MSMYSRSYGSMQQEGQQQRNHAAARSSGGNFYQQRQYRNNASTSARATATSTASASSVTQMTVQHQQEQQVVMMQLQQPPPPMLDQIANLLNLAQNLMDSVKQQQEMTHQSQQLNCRTTRRQARNNIRDAAALPYHRNAGGNLNSNRQQTELGNNNQNYSQQMNATPFCSCNECKVLKWRSHVTRGLGGSLFPIKNQKQSPEEANPASTSNNSQPNFQCSICLEPYLNKRPTVTLCGHIFCRLCILTCVKSQGKCAICNRKLNLTNVFRVFI